MEKEKLISDGSGKEEFVVFCFCLKQNFVKKSSSFTLIRIGFNL